MKKVTLTLLEGNKLTGFSMLPSTGIAVEEVIDRVMGQSIRGAMREAVKNAGPAIDEEIRTMYMTEDLREQVMAARARMEEPL
jgi:hypothetical protein